MNVRELIHGKENPFDGVTDTLARKGPNWGSTHEWFGELIEEINPVLIIEAGSFLGGSAIHMAEHLTRLNFAGHILCVDTWLGGVDHLQDRAAWEELMRPFYGRPTIYQSFMANVVRARQTERITPFSMDTLNAARFLYKNDVRAQMIYVDASHESGDVRRDLDYYWELLAPEGAMLVDDLTGHFPGLVKDVEQFVSDRGLTLQVSREKGVIRKV